MQNCYNDHVRRLDLCKGLANHGIRGAPIGEYFLREYLRQAGGVNMNEAVAIPKKRGNFGWFKVLLVGIGLYFFSLIIMVVTSNPNLFPTVALIGNFLVPIAYVAFFYERRHLSQLSLPTTAYTFFYGGLLGVLASSILEPIFIRSMDPISVMLIGLIEEGAKILGVLAIARSRRHDSEMDGLILGAAAGMGFAALESMGYAFSAFLESNGSLSATVITTLMRGILAPIGHGTWTAILASVLFRESAGKRFRINAKVIGAYLLVSFLHATWDGVPPLISDMFSSGLDVLIAQSIIGGTGFLVLFLRWREAKRLQTAQESGMALEEQKLEERLIEAMPESTPKALTQEKPEPHPDEAILQEEPEQQKPEQER